MTTHTISTEWKGGMKFVAQNPGGTIALDADKEVGGLDKGLRPKALMLTALAGCTAMDVASLSKKMRAEPLTFKIEIKAELTDEHPKHYNKVHIDYYFTGKNLKEDKLTKAVTLSVEKYCGVMEMFRAFSKLSHTIHFN